MEVTHSGLAVQHLDLPVETYEWGRDGFSEVGQRSFQGYVSNVSAESHQLGRHTLQQWLEIPAATAFSYQAYVVTNFPDGSVLESTARRHSNGGSAYETRDRNLHDCYRVMFFGPGASTNLDTRLCDRFNPITERELASMIAVSAIVKTNDHTTMEELHAGVVRDLRSGLDLLSAFDRLRDACVIRGLDCFVNPGFNTDYQLKNAT